MLAMVIDDSSAMRLILGRIMRSLGLTLSMRPTVLKPSLDCRAASCRTSLLSTGTCRSWTASRS